VCEHARAQLTKKTMNTHLTLLAYAVSLQHDQPKHVFSLEKHVLTHVYATVMTGVKANGFGST
jgi:hypothetical protein